MSTLQFLPYLLRIGIHRAQQLIGCDPSDQPGSGLPQLREVPRKVLLRLRQIPAWFFYLTKSILPKPLLD